MTIKVVIIPHSCTTFYKYNASLAYNYKNQGYTYIKERRDFLTSYLVLGLRMARKILLKEGLDFQDR